MKNRNFVLFYLNGERHEIKDETAGLMLSDYLRYNKTLTGTKIVCAEGDCGACTVLRYFPLQNKNKTPVFLPVNSCIATVAQMDSCSLVTIEALALTHAPVQSAMIKCHGSQCGFCTPGIVVALAGLVEKKLNEKYCKNLAVQESKNALTGNLCRCTGYQPILEAASKINLKDCEMVYKRFYSKLHKEDLLKQVRIPLLINTEKFKYYAPTTIANAAAYYSKAMKTNKLNNKIQIIAAATDLGVLHNKRKNELTSLLSLHLIPQLYEIKKISATRISVGARVTLEEIRKNLKMLIPEFTSFLDLFASPQIKNIATLIGNIANASPIADTAPFLMLMNCEVETQSLKKIRKVKLEEFFLGYRKTGLNSNEIILSLQFDIPKKSEILALYKVSQRKDLDISAVNFAARLIWSDKNKTKIKDVKISLGGVAATTLRLYKTENVLMGKFPTPQILAEALTSLHEEIKPYDDLRGTASFRHVVSENLFNKFFREKIL